MLTDRGRAKGRTEQTQETDQADLSASRLPRRSHPQWSTDLAAGPRRAGDDDPLGAGNASARTAQRRLDAQHHSYRMGFGINSER